jgi:hypothetical protein
MASCWYVHLVGFEEMVRQQMHEKTLPQVSSAHFWFGVG